MKCLLELISQSKLECLEQTTTSESEDTMAIMEINIKHLIIKTEIYLRSHIPVYQVMELELIVVKFLHSATML